MAAKKSKKQRKVGRDKIHCSAYRAAHRREHNKIRRLNKHLLRFPNDRCAEVAKDRAKTLIRGF